jgi:hypothetical protein
MLISDFNHARNANGEFVLVEGTKPLPDDDSCRGSEEYWAHAVPAYYPPHPSSCENGERPDRGRRHLCPGVAAHGLIFWLFVLLVPFAFTTIISAPGVPPAPSACPAAMPARGSRHRMLVLSRRSRVYRGSSLASRLLWLRR